MFQQFADRLRNSEFNFRLLVPLLASTMLVQMVTALIRITTSYRAVELELSIVWLGVIAATFAIVPILMAVRVGRFIDRGHDAQVAWIGSGIFTVACARLRAVVVAGRASGLVHRAGHRPPDADGEPADAVRARRQPARPGIGVRQLHGGRRHRPGHRPLCGRLPRRRRPRCRRPACCSRSVLCWRRCRFAVVLTMRPRAGPAAALTDGEIVPVGQIVRVPGLVAVVVTGVIVVSSSDALVVYIPLLGAERHIDVHDIGLLLTVRAAASMLARLFYARMVTAFGRWPLMTTNTFAFAATYAAIAVPLPLWAMYLTITIMGFAFGVATTLSITIVVDMTTAGARGTANSLRIMSNRIGQFAMPFGAGLVAAADRARGLVPAAGRRHRRCGRGDGVEAATGVKRRSLDLRPARRVDHRGAGVFSFTLSARQAPGMSCACQNKLRDTRRYRGLQRRGRPCT